MSTRPEREVTIAIGDVHASADAIVLKTVLGSCVSVCLFDPVSRIGGMNHFMLPHGRGGDLDPRDASRFGVHAMDCLIGAMQKLGADRRRCIAKYFGAGHVLDGVLPARSVPQLNIEFVRAFLHTEGIPVASHDVGGSLPRVLRFRPTSGVVLVKRLVGSSVRRDVVRREAQRSAEPPRYGSIELFE